MIPDLGEHAIRVIPDVRRVEHTSTYLLNGMTLLDTVS